VSCQDAVDGAALDQRTGAIDIEPVVKLFPQEGNAPWLLTELDPIGGHLAFSLCDLGQGEPELGCALIGHYHTELLAA
jgi:Protein of unknown function (DUF2958)